MYECMKYVGVCMYVNFYVFILYVRTYVRIMYACFWTSDC